MNIYLIYLICLIVGYLFGSVPGALIIGKIFFKKDVRNMGSGNLGATNVARTIGVIPGFLTLFFDFFKVIASTYLMFYVTKNLTIISDINYNYLTVVFCLTGIATCIGHCYPIFAKFKGGKCVSVIGGFVIGSNWILVIIGLSIFVISMIIKRIVSISSISMALITSILSFFLPFVYKGSYIIEYTTFYSITILLMSILLTIRHYPNIIKLIHHEEKEFRFKTK